MANIKFKNGYVGDRVIKITLIEYSKFTFMIELDYIDTNIEKNFFNLFEQDKKYKLRFLAVGNIDKKLNIKLTEYKLIRTYDNIEDYEAIESFLVNELNEDLRIKEDIILLRMRSEENFDNIKINDIKTPIVNIISTNKFLIKGTIYIYDFKDGGIHSVEFNCNGLINDIELVVDNVVLIDNDFSKHYEKVEEIFKTRISNYITDNALIFDTLQDKNKSQSIFD